MQAAGGGRSRVDARAADAHRRFTGAVSRAGATSISQTRYAFVDDTFITAFDAIHWAD